MTQRLWDAGSKVRLRKQILLDFLDDLSEIAVPMGYTVYVTSGYRSPEDQARVVCNNVQTTNGGNLSIYGQKTQQVYRTHCPHNMEAIIDYETKAFEARLKANPNYQGHGNDLALDLSVYGLTNSQKLKYKEIIESLGAEVLWEKSPEHFHIYLRNFSSPRRIKRIIFGVLGTTTVGVIAFFGLKYLDEKGII